MNVLLKIDLRIKWSLVDTKGCFTFVYRRAWLSHVAKKIILNAISQCKIISIATAGLLGQNDQN